MYKLTNNNNKIINNNFIRKYHYKFAKKFDWGFIEIYILMRLDIIEKIVTFTDYFDDKLQKNICDILVGKSIYDLYKMQIDKYDKYDKYDNKIIDTIKLIKSIFPDI